MKIRRFFLSFAIAISLIAISPTAAQAGGGCGSNAPRISNYLAKPGQTFEVTTDYVMYDVSLSLYKDPNYVPYVSFSSSIPWLNQSSELISATAEGGKYKATFQVPIDFIGNMELQAIVFNICGSSGNQGTYGPKVIIQSDESIPNCVIESVKVSDYSVNVGEEFKVAFHVYSNIKEIQPYVELTEYKQVTRFPARLAGSSTSNSLRVYEATVSYKQARQYPYGAIARPEVKDLCNSSGDREVIGIMGYITSKAMIKEINKGAECSNGTPPINSLDYMGVNEALVCANYPVGSIRYSWRNAAEVNAAKAAAEKAVGDQKAKQEADAKAAADKVVAEAKAEAAKILAEANAQAKAAAAAAAAEAKAAAAAKKTTITCVKGKLTKKVIAVKPVCPKGYKKK
jgi:hypothetical protein